jgi:deferrochelatase/peroxidase EfeB
VSDPGPSRRGFLAGVTGLAAGTAATPALAAPKGGDVAPRGAAEPFYGRHQSGILTPAQSHCTIASFDISASDKTAVAAMLQRWTEASARLTAGLPAQPPGSDRDAPAGDSGESLDLAPARLTLTFGFGAGLFVRDGTDRFGLAARRPEAFVDLPNFPGEQLAEPLTGGDLVIQACADDPQLPFHAIRQLSRLAYEVAELRWVQSGFIGNFAKTTPRNLMGFKDGTGNPSTADAKLMDQHIWVGAEGPAWMRGGSYVVFRRSRMALEHWDRMKVSFQEQTFGREKHSGAPLGAHHEADKVDLDATDQDGNPIIPENAHIRLASADNNGGARILRRSYSYNNGVSFVAERWPPWHQGMEYDAGLIFVCFQRDPRAGFIQINEKLSRFDMMNQFVTNIGGGLFACPRGVEKGSYIGRDLFE